MTATQRAAMQAALAFIQDIDRDDIDRDILTQSQCLALDASRNALRAALAEPVGEPVIDDSIVLAACQKLAPTLFTRGLKPLETDGAHWRARMHEVEATVRTVLSFVKPSPPAGPAGPAGPAVEPVDIEAFAKLVRNAALEEAALASDLIADRIYLKQDSPLGDSAAKCAKQIRSLKS